MILNKEGAERPRDCPDASVGIVASSDMDARPHENYFLTSILLSRVIFLISE
jgi:hypothetical protein